MKLTAKQIEGNFIAEVNKVGVKNFAHMDASKGYQAYELRMANGNLRYWKVKNGKELEFEGKLRMVSVE